MLGDAVIGLVRFLVSASSTVITLTGKGKNLVQRFSLYIDPVSSGGNSELKQGFSEWQHLISDVAMAPKKIDKIEEI